MKKSGKRELAVVVLLWFAYIVETKDANIVEILVWPVFTLIAAAFGFHSYATQLQQNISSRSSYKTSGDYSTDTDWQREQSSRSKPDSPD